MVRLGEGGRPRRIAEEFPSTIGFSPARELVDALFVQPYCRIQNLVDAGIAKRQTASVYLGQLVEIGMLTERKLGRDKLFVHEAFLRLLTSDDNRAWSYATVSAR